MKPSFILITTECCNNNQDSPCRIILQPVQDGVLQEQLSFLINPDGAPFYWTVSGLSPERLEKERSFPEVWPNIEEALFRFPLLVSDADGYSARVLHGALERYGLKYAPIPYMTAKNLCRKGLDAVIYRLDYLSNLFLKEDIEEEDIPGKAVAWAELVILALEQAEDTNIIDFVKGHRLKFGQISPDGFTKARTIKKPRALPTIDDVIVEADKDNPFYGMGVVFTGKMLSLTRVEAQKMVLRVGGNIPKTVNKDTDFLVVGEQDIRVVGADGMSGKMKKAQTLREIGHPIEIISEQDFLEMIK